MMDLGINSSLWTADQPPKNPPLNQDISVDLAVIGGGYTGLSSALHIKERFPERQVVVLEARSAGHGASGRNGGMLLTPPMGEYMTVSNPVLHKTLYDIGKENIDRVASLMHAQGLASGIRRDGALVMSTSQKKARKAKAYVAEAISLGMPLEYWPKERIIQEVGTDIYLGGIYDPTAAEVNPMKLVHALKKAAENAGVVIYEESPVTETKAGSIIQLMVSVDGGKKYRVSAGSIVMATNGYIPHTSLLKNKLVSVHTEMAATAPLQPSIFEEIGWKSRITFHDDRNLLYHLGSTEDNRISIGAGNSVYYYNNHLIYKDGERRRRPLQNELVRIFPKLEGTELKVFWTGVMGVSLRLVESIGVMGKEKNIFYGLGYAGHGVNMSTLAGRIITDLYAGEAERWQAVPYVNRWLPDIPPEPFKWIGYWAVSKLMKFSDFLNER